MSPFHPISYRWLNPSVAVWFHDCYLYAGHNPNMITLNDSQSEESKAEGGQVLKMYGTVMCVGYLHTAISWSCLVDYSSYMIWKRREFYCDSVELQSWKKMKRERERERDWPLRQTSMKLHTVDEHERSSGRCNDTTYLKPGLVWQDD